jgi:hypothetical protein
MLIQVLLNSSLSKQKSKLLRESSSSWKAFAVWLLDYLTLATLGHSSQKS